MPGLLNMADRGLAGALNSGSAASSMVGTNQLLNQQQQMMLQENVGTLAGLAGQQAIGHFNKDPDPSATPTAGVSPTGLADAALLRAGMGNA